MKQKILTILAAVAIILGMGSCTTNDNPTTPSVDVNNLEKELVGLWWDEYEYADVTEDGVPFTRVLLAVRANADHTGCIYLGVFDDQGDEPLAVYGGPEEAGFKWQLKADGTIVLTDPASGESISMARTRGEGGSYGKDMTNVANTSATYTSGNVTVTNGSYSGILEKADAGKAADIENTLSKQSTAISAASEDGTIGKYTDKNGVEREGIVVTLDGKKYLIAMSNETANASITSGSSFYTFADAVKHFTDDSENGKEDYSDSHVWRLPTEAEIGYLAGIPNKAWDRANKGYKWTFGSSSASLLLPAAGFWSDLVYKVGWQGSYWSSTPSRLYRDYAYVLYFDEDGVKVYNSNRKHGDSVRLFCQLPLWAFATVTTLPAAVERLVYTGSAQALITAGAADGGTLMYKVAEAKPVKNADDWSASVPTRTDVGTYKVWYYVKGDDNHYDSNVYKTAIKVTINAPARALSEATADDLGKIVGADGMFYETQAAATAAGTSGVAMIAYVGSGTGHDTYKHGLAIALADVGGRKDWWTAKSTCENKTPKVNGGAWMLPSRDQWKTMFKANGDNESNYTGLNTKLKNAGGAAFQLYLGYWSSTEISENRAYLVDFVDFNNGNADIYGGPKENNILARACLAF